TVFECYTLIELYLHIFGLGFALCSHGLRHGTQIRGIKAVRRSRLVAFKLKSGLQYVLPSLAATHKYLLLPVVLYKCIVVGLIASPHQEALFSLPCIVNRVDGWLYDGVVTAPWLRIAPRLQKIMIGDRKSTRLDSSHVKN